MDTIMDTATQVGVVTSDIIGAQLLLLIAHWSYHRQRGYLQHSVFEICSRHATRYTDHLEAAEIVAFA